MPDTPSLEDVLASPKFKALGSDENKRLALSHLYPKFGKLSESEQNMVFGGGKTDPPSSIGSSVLGALGSGVYKYGEVAKGAVKGAGKTAENLADLTGKAATGSGIPPTWKKAIDAKLEPSNDLQRGGKGVEQVEEMFAPIPGISSLKAPAAASPFLKVLYGAGREALDVGSKTLAQTGDPKQAAVGAATGAAFGAAGAALPKVAGAVRRSAEKEYAQVLSPGTKADKFVTKNKLLTDKGKDLLDRGVTAMTEQGLKGKIEDKALQAHVNLIKGWEAIGPEAQHSMMPILDDLQNSAIDQATEKVGKGQFETPGMPGRRIVNPELYKAYQDKMSNLIEVLGPKADQATAFQLKKVRQLMDEEVRASFRGAKLTNTEDKVTRATADAIRRVISGQNPSLGALNKELSFWLSAKEVFENTEMRKVGQKRALLHMAKAAGGVAGAIAGGTGGAHMGHGESGSVAGFVLGGMASKKMEEVLSSTAWRTTSAGVKNRVARLLASGKIEEATRIAAKATAAGINRYQDQPPPASQEAPP